MHAKIAARHHTDGGGENRQRNQLVRKAGKRHRHEQIQSAECDRVDEFLKEMQVVLADALPGPRRASGSTAQNADPSYPTKTQWWCISKMQIWWLAAKRFRASTVAVRVSAHIAKLCKKRQRESLALFRSTHRTVFTVSGCVDLARRAVPDLGRRIFLDVDGSVGWSRHDSVAIAIEKIRQDAKADDAVKRCQNDALFANPQDVDNEAEPKELEEPHVHREHATHDDPLNQPSDQPHAAHARERAQRTHLCGRLPFKHVSLWLSDASDAPFIRGTESPLPFIQL
jgi:hypothetical protein